MKAFSGKGERRVPNDRADGRRVPGLDQQFCELVETVYACERRWSVEDRIDAAISYRSETK